MNTDALSELSSATRLHASIRVQQIKILPRKKALDVPRFIP